MTGKQDQRNREEIVGILLRLFRCGGYDGVSLGDISKATGLGKSSLYHHFPGGKADMAAAVIAFADDWLKENIHKPLASDAPLPERIDGMLKSASALYGGGTAPCLVASMMQSREDSPPDAAIGNLLGQWIDAISASLQRAGQPKATADARAANALVRIEGALIVGRATNRIQIFEDALAQTRADLLAS